MHSSVFLVFWLSDWAVTLCSRLAQMKENCIHMLCVVSTKFEPAHVILILLAFLRNEGSDKTAQTCLSLYYYHTQSMDEDENSEQKLVDDLVVRSMLQLSDRW